MSKCRLPELLKTPAQRFYSNITGNNRAAKEITSNRENVKDIKPAVTQNESFGAVGTHRQDCKDEHKPSNTYESSSTDDVSIGIDESRSVRFRNNLFVVSLLSQLQRSIMKQQII